MEYIRVYLGFFENLKTKKLFRLCGYQGVTCLLRLWIYATQNKPDGILDMTNEDIELQTDWRGEPDKFVSGLIESGYLVLDENSYLLHDWIENNPHLNPLAVQKRKLRASKGGIARAKKLASKQKDCATKQSQAEIKQENCANKLINKQIKKETILSGLKKDSKPNGVPYEEIVNHLNKVCGTKYRYTSKEIKKHINARWNEKFTLEDFKTVIDKKHKEWGKDPEWVKFLRPETLFGNKFEGYLNQITVETDFDIQMKRLKEKEANEGK